MESQETEGKIQFVSKESSKGNGVEGIDWERQRQEDTNKQRNVFFLFSVKIVCFWMLFLALLSAVQMMVPIFICEFEGLSDIKFGFVFGTATISILGLLHTIGRSIFRK